MKQLPHGSGIMIGVLAGLALWLVLGRIAGWW